MQQTVVGVFDSIADARKAADDLAVRGVPPQRVHVSEQAADAGSLAGGGSSPSTRQDDDGVLSHIKHFFEGLFGDDDESSHYAEAVRRGGAIVKVDVDGDSDLARVTEALDDAGAVDIEERANQWRADGWDAGSSGSAAARSGTVGSAAATGASADLDRTAGSRSMGTGAVRVYARPIDTPVDETVALRSNQRSGDEDDTTYDDDFRSDYQSRYGASGGSYADYEPAYRYGNELRSDARYNGRSWDEVEPHVRADWESRNGASGWEKVKAAVRHAWERVTD